MNLFSFCWGSRATRPDEVMALKVGSFGDLRLSWRACAMGGIASRTGRSMRNTEAGDQMTLATASLAIDYIHHT